jgi:glycosyltransferase involved in cell wall biosynthesis
MGVYVLDANSDDRTVEIATRMGAHTELRAWGGFVDARRFALAQVKTPWTFMLDADEMLDATLARALLEAGEECTAYIVRRTTLFCGKPLRRWTAEPFIRLFRTDRGRLEARPAGGGKGEVHERWLVEGDVRELPGTLVHNSYPTLESYRRKFDAYTSIEAGGLQTSRTGLARTSLIAVARFGWQLVGRGALLDGWRGLYVAFWSELYPVVVHWKALRKRTG